MASGREMREWQNVARADKPSASTEPCDTPESREPLYLFACHLEWRNKKSLNAYQELIAALDDANAAIRAVAEDLLSHRSSPRPKEGRQRTEELAD